MKWCAKNVIIWDVFNENDNEGEENYAEENNFTEVDSNDDNNNNEEEQNNLVNDALVMDVERDDSSRHARKKPLRLHKKMGKYGSIMHA